MKTLRKIVKKIIGIEHSIYCATNCKIELPLHRKYYEYRKAVYEEYLFQKALGLTK